MAELTPTQLLIVKFLGKSALKDGGLLERMLDSVSSDKDKFNILKQVKESGLYNVKSKSGHKQTKEEKEALKRLSDPKQYKRSGLAVAMQDYVAPAASAGFSLLGNVLGAQYNIPGAILQGMANKGSNQRREQHGSSLLDIMASAYMPVGSVKGYAASATGNTLGNVINDMANRSRAASLAEQELAHQRDMLIAYGNNRDIPAAEYGLLTAQQTSRKDAMNNMAQAYQVPVYGAPHNGVYPSDARIKEIISHAGKLTPDEVLDLVQAAGDMDGCCFDSDGDNWDDSVMNKYADFIQNYMYTYKPEAKAIDPGIDPNQEQIGPMAQDIEQVNPACVQETEDGIKTVDTRKLALMNAGVIADLVREVKEIKEMLK